MVRLAAALFSVRAYDGTSVDDPVAHLGVHRNSLYKTFGSKRGLDLAALRWFFEHDLAPLLGRIAQRAGLQEVVDTETAALDQAAATAAGAAKPTGAPGTATAVTSVLLGLRVRTRSGAPG